MTTRPELVTDGHLLYLDILRKSGVVNMCGAGAYVEKAYGLSWTDARTILTYWIESYGNENR